MRPQTYVIEKSIPVFATNPVHDNKFQRGWQGTEPEVCVGGPRLADRCLLLEMAIGPTAGRLKVGEVSMPQSVVVSDPEILGGTPCFRGTRVPVDSLIDYLEAGDSLDEFLDNFPSVSREAAIAALEEAKTLLTSRR